MEVSNAKPSLAHPMHVIGVLQGNAVLMRGSLNHSDSDGQEGDEGDEDGGDGWEVAAKSKTARRHKVQKAAKRAEREELQQMQEETGGDDQEDEGDDEEMEEDMEGEEADEGEEEGSTPAFESNVASVTADFAMQNVILQMGLRLVTPDGRRIKEVHTWVLRCSACLTTTREVRGRLLPLSLMGSALHAYIFSRSHFLRCNSSPHVVGRIDGSVPGPLLSADFAPLLPSVRQCQPGQGGAHHRAGRCGAVWRPQEAQPARDAVLAAQAQGREEDQGPGAARGRLDVEGAEAPD